MRESCIKVKWILKSEDKGILPQTIIGNRAKIYAINPVIYLFNKCGVCDLVPKEYR